MSKHEIIIKKTVILAVFSVSLVIIGIIFWNQELQYTQPTPVPAGYDPIVVSQPVKLGFLPFQGSAKPSHLHFFNPYCPCSKFNLTHFKDLVKEYRDQVNFYVIIPSEGQFEEVREEFDNKLPVIIDKGKKIANTCGVYSTPQAVILDTDGKLYYRGNYNKSRYCTLAASNYAQLALDALLKGEDAPVFGQLSVTAYGCGLNKENGIFNIDALWNK